MGIMQVARVTYRPQALIRGQCNGAIGNFKLEISTLRQRW